MAGTSFPFKELMKKPNLENTFKFLSENKNGATIIACSIAVFKGIFRPIFTMMDKKQDPEAKKYAAIREGLTEVAALPIYAATPFLVGKVIDNFYKGKSIEKVKMNAKFLGICAATLIIPAVCNVVQPPIMRAYKKRQEAKKGLDINSVQSPTTISNPTVVNKQLKMIEKPQPNKMNYGMRVGN